jgi:hypothetical protein
MSKPKVKGYERQKESMDQASRDKGTQTPPRQPGGDIGREGREREDFDVRPRGEQPPPPEEHDQGTAGR